MFLLKPAALAITFTLPLLPLTLGATVPCGDTPTTNFALSDLQDLKSFIDSGSVPPIPMPGRFAAGGSAGSSVNAIPRANIQLCMQNKFLFESTTVFPDELSEFVGLHINCLNRVPLGFAPKLDGNTGLDVDGRIQPLGDACECEIDCE